MIFCLFNIVMVSLFLNLIKVDSVNLLHYYLMFYLEQSGVMLLIFSKASSHVPIKILFQDLHVGLIDLTTF